MKIRRNVPGRQIGEITRRYSKDRPTRFYTTGIKALDEFTGGLPSGEMTLLAARPAAGKTALAMQFLEHISTFHAEPTGIFSIEMSGRSLVTRMVLGRTGLPSIPLRKGELTQKQMGIRDKALEEIGKLPMYIDDSSYATIRHVEKVSRAWIKAGIKLLALDYIQLIAAGARAQGDTRGNFIGECARSIKCIAKDGDVPFLALSQLNRESEKGKRPPTAADLRDSGELEQVADNIMMLHPDRENPPYVDIILAKWRNGSSGTISTQFDGARTRFESIDESDR